MRWLLILLTVHFVGDFLCQTNWMATNKSKSWLALTAHVSAYTAVFLAPMAYLLGETSVLWQFLGLTFALHFVTDAITSRITSRLWFVSTRADYRDFTVTCRLHFDDPKRHWFFVAIGFDQLLHAFALAFTAHVLGL